MGPPDVETLPSHMRPVPGSVNIPIAKIPHREQPGNVDAEKVAAEFVNSFNTKLQSSDYQALSKLFLEDGYWRDHLALTWAFRTLQTPNKIHDFLKTSATSKDGFRLKSISVDAGSPSRAPSVSSLGGPNNPPCVCIFLRLETALGAGQGIARLVLEDGKWRIFSLYTKLDELKGYEEDTFERRPRGVEHGGKPGRKNWAQRREEESEVNGDQEPTVIIIGAGQAGLTIAARLKMLGVNALIVDQNERVGDNWRKRYKQLVLHDPVWYDHLPYMPFPPQWPIFTPKDKLAQFFEAYATLMELNVWTKTTITNTKWDESSSTWSITVKREKDGKTETRTFHPRHVVQATGHSGKKNQPTWKGIDDFKGHLLCHSSEFPGAREDARGKKAVIVGACNSSHDIAQDFLEKGYDVTIVQRSSTNVISSESITEIGLKGLYSEDGPPVDDADLLLHSTPSSVLKAQQVEITKRQNENDREILEGLEKAGFEIDQGPDDAGLFIKYFQRGGGYYIDVGASTLIAEGKIKVKNGQEIVEVLPHGLKFADGSELEADEIVLATGYQNMRTETRTILGDEVADKVGDVWGFNEEGEMRTMWQSSGHPGFWFHGGNLSLCRFYSRLLALQIKGLEEGLYKSGEI